MMMRRILLAGVGCAAFGSVAHAQVGAFGGTGLTTAQTTAIASCSTALQPSGVGSGLSFTGGSTTMLGSGIVSAIASLQSTATASGNFTSSADISGNPITATGASSSRTAAALSADELAVKAIAATALQPTGAGAGLSFVSGSTTRSGATLLADQITDEANIASLQSAATSSGSFTTSTDVSSNPITATGASSSRTAAAISADELAVKALATTALQPSGVGTALSFVSGSTTRTGATVLSNQIADEANITSTTALATSALQPAGAGTNLSFVGSSKTLTGAGVVNAIVALQSSSGTGTSTPVAPTVETAAVTLTASMCTIPRTRLVNNSSNAISYTVPASTLTTGCQIVFSNIGTGSVTLVAASGETVGHYDPSTQTSGTGSTILAGQYAVAVLTQETSTVATVAGGS